MVKPTFGTFVKGASSLAQFWRKTLLLVDNWHQVKIQLFLKIIHMHVPSFYKKENILSFIILKYPTTLIYSKPDEQLFWKLLMYFSFNTIRYLHIYFIFSHVLKPDELETNLVFFQTSISLRNSSVIRVLVSFFKRSPKNIFLGTSYEYCHWFQIYQDPFGLVMSSPITLIETWRGSPYLINDTLCT